MKKIIIPLVILVFTACNSSKKDKPADNPQPQTAEPTPSTSTTPPPAPRSSGVVYDVEGTNITNSASVLVSKDKDKLKADAPYMCLLTSNAATHDNEYLTVNFLLDTKPGVYPIVGSSLNRGKGDNNQMFGGILGGKPKLTSDNVTIIECKDLGDNGMGGHKWSISGTWEGLAIKALPMMLMDKTKSHPAEVKLGKGTFSNLTFDDNWEEMMEKAMEKMKKN